MQWLIEVAFFLLSVHTRLTAGLGIELRLCIWCEFAHIVREVKSERPSGRGGWMYNGDLPFGGAVEVEIVNRLVI